jgi:ribose/xylose/arabinose/galactoside ABC-type transport system permease subunit
MTTLTTQPGSTRGRALAWRVFKDYGFLMILALVMCVFALLNRAFVSPNNLIGILYQVSMIGIMAVCSTFVLITGGVDLSVGAIVALSGLVASFVLEAPGQSLVLALLAGVMVGIVVGFLNGVIVARFDLPAMMVTLATMSIVRGVALLLGEANLHLIRQPESFLFIGSGRLFGLPFPIYIFAAAAASMMFIQVRTRFGLHVFAVGENLEAARLAGLPLIGTKALVYTISGIGAAIAGLVLSSQVHTASAVYGNGLELDVIASIVLGGTSLMGGSGSVHRSVLGALLIGIINNGLSMLNVNIQLQLVVKGLIIILALTADRYLQADR